MQKFIDSHWFPRFEILLVLASGLILYQWPTVGGWSLLLPLAPWGIRLIAGQFPVQRTVFDWLIVIFVVTVLVGYWAAYDKNAALHKLWLLLLAVLFYYALSSQPVENLGWLSGIFFSISVGISFYFFLTHDFVNLPRKLQIVNNFGRWIMQVRPQVSWKPIHPNYVAGVAAIMGTFGFYPLWKARNQGAKTTRVLSIVIVVSCVFILFTIFMATSRGVILAVLSAIGSLVVWKVLRLEGANSRFQPTSLFPILVLVYLAVVVSFLYIGPASFTGSVASQSSYGTGTRAELFARSAYFLTEFPFTGGGLSSFPGLYSFYMLGVPFFYLPNSHNLFLDVAIEQGIVAGILYLFLFLGSVWFVSQSIVKSSSTEIRAFSWLVLFALMIAIIHGMVDDYLYNGNGALLALFLIGISMIARRERPGAENLSLYLDYRIAGFLAAIIIGVCILNFDRVRSVWYSNLGSVQMEDVELAGFPINQWTDATIIPRLHTAETSLHSSLRYNAGNPAANYRLGMISILRQDFKTASMNLEIAHEAEPSYRGITKSLGYCYAWLGEMDKAKVLLQQIPEAQQELGAYAWWWNTHGRSDLANDAFQLASQLNSPGE